MAANSSDFNAASPYAGRQIGIVWRVMGEGKYREPENSLALVARAVEYTELILARHPGRLPLILRKLRDMRNALAVREDARAALSRLEAYIRRLEQRVAGR